MTWSFAGEAILTAGRGALGSGLAAPLVNVMGVAGAGVAGAGVVATGVVATAGGGGGGGGGGGRLSVLAPHAASRATETETRAIRDP
jgi:hypothetical protein